VADTKTSALSAASAAAGANEIPINEAGTSKKVTVTQIRDYLKTLGLPEIVRLSSDHAISSVTATEVTGLQFTGLVAGTYIFEYFVLAQSATSTVSPMLGINFTGTATARFRMRYPGTGTTAISGVADDVGATSGQIEESVAQTTFSTTTPNLGATGGVATTGTNILYIIEGVLIVTATGDLEVWHGSETATSTTVKTDSCGRLTRVA